MQCGSGGIGLYREQSRGKIRSAERDQVKIYAAALPFAIAELRSNEEAAVISLVASCHDMVLYSVLFD